MPFRQNNRNDEARKERHGAPPASAGQDRPTLDDFESLREEVFALRGDWR
jgi:hypothetical protein